LEAESEPDSTAVETGVLAEEAFLLLLLEEGLGLLWAVPPAFGLEGLEGFLLGPRVLLEAEGFFSSFLGG
jgi:hypothetical protein